MRAPRRLARLPTVCAVCRGWGTGRLCGECVARHVRPVPRCRTCASAIPTGTGQCGACLVEPPPQARTVAAVDYRAPWDGLVARLKFHAALDLADPLAERLAIAIDAAGEAPPDVVVPAPLAPGRLSERGYNQAWEIARRLGARADATLLLRIRDGVPQAELPREQRLAAVRGAYALEPRRRGDVAGRHVAVVDDVLTTGASAAEMARTLLGAGAARVSVWVVARTPAPGAE